VVAVTRAQAQAGTPEPEALGLRERRKQRVEAELERIALERFAARGFDAVTVEELAAAADVSRRTFFRYFPSKEDVSCSRADERRPSASRPCSPPSLAAASTWCDAPCSSSHASTSGLASAS
jgi:hypothetical protein